MALRVQFNDLELVGFDTGGSEIFHYQGLPFTGILETIQNGILCSEEEFQEGYKEGLQRRYFFPSGNLEAEFTLKNNGFNGTFKLWDDNGNLISQSNWQDGIKI
jgi:antitoxin component YwqK of YwqJK toxin-antitoxin module